MASKKLHQLWKQIESDLSDAASYLPTEGLEHLHYADYLKYISHNELELASDMLAELAYEIDFNHTSFWHAMSEACKKMGLAIKAERYARHMVELD